MASEEAPITAPTVNELGGGVVEAVNVEAGKAQPRPSRSRCFRVYKVILVGAVISMMILTLASTPWCIDLTRELLHEIMNSTAPLYVTESPVTGDSLSGNKTELITDTLIYGVVGISLLITMIFLIFGLVSIWCESTGCSIVFSILLFICFGASFCCYDRLLFLINMSIDLVLALLVLLYAVVVKRADRLAPTSGSPTRTAQDGNEKSKKKKGKKEKKKKKDKEGKKKDEEKLEEGNGAGKGSSSDDEKV